ncbi:MAG: hypothetical protein AAFX76_11540 [Planctomycetota bacterium]
MMNVASPPRPKLRQRRPHLGLRLGRSPHRDRSRTLSLASEAYEQGYFDATVYRQGVRYNLTMFGVTGVEGDAWRLGYADASQGQPRRDLDELRRWLDPAHDAARQRV